MGAFLLVVATLCAAAAVEAAPAAAAGGEGGPMSHLGGPWNDLDIPTARLHRRGFKSSLLSTARGFGKRSENVVPDYQMRRWGYRYSTVGTRNKAQVGKHRRVPYGESFP